MSRFHDAEENREEVVKMVKSCLVLNKGGLPITELNKVYRDLVGNNVPYRVLGYPTLQDFMQSIPEVYCSGKNADGVLILNVQDDNLKHIQDLVSHQKCAKKRPTRKYESSRYSGGSFKNSYTKYGSQISNKNYGSSRQNNRAPRFSTNNSSLRKPFTQNSNYDSSNCYSAENVVQSTKREEYSSQHERQAPRCYSTNEKIETENWETPSYENRERAHDVKENYFSRHTGTKVEESCTRFANHSAVEQEILLQSRLQFINNSKASLHKSETATSKINVPYDLTSSNKYYIEKSNYKIRPIVKQLEAAQGDKYVVMAPQEKPLTSGYQNKPETSYTSGETNSITLRLPSFNIRKEEFMKSHKFNPDVVLDLLAKSPGMSVPLRPSTTSVSSNEQSQQFRNSYPPGLNLPTPSSFQMESQWFNKTSNISSDLSMSPRIQTESQHFKNMNPLPDFTHVKEPNSKFVTETPRSKNDNCPPGFLLPVQVSSHCPGTIEQTENSKNIEASNNLTNIKDSKDTECFQMTKPTFQAMPLKAPTVCMTGEQPQWFKKATPHLGVDWTRKFIKKTLTSTSSTGATKSNANKISQDENLFNQDSSTLTENVCQKSKTLDEDFSDASLSKKTLNVFSQNENASSNQSEVAPIMEKLSLQVSPTPSISTDQANENVDEKVSNVIVISANYTNTV